MGRRSHPPSLNAVKSERPLQVLNHPDLEVIKIVSGVYSAYRWKNVAVTFWFDAATMESLRSFERGASETCALHPEGLSLVMIMVPGGRSMPSAEVRAKFGQISAMHAQFIAAAAVLIPGTGFWPSAIRGLVTAISLLAPPKYDFEVFDSLSDVASWLTPIHAARTGVELDHQVLLRVMQAAQSHAASAAV